jgi:hypothetical protein
MSIAVGAATSICQPLEAAFLIAIEDLVTGLARNPKFRAEFRHGLAGGEPQIAVSHPSPNTPSKASLPKRRKSVPMCPVRSVTYVSGRSTSDLAEVLYSPNSSRVHFWFTPLSTIVFNGT